MIWNLDELESKKWIVIPDWNHSEETNLEKNIRDKLIKAGYYSR